MKYITIILVILISTTVNAQSTLPTFLQGTWKMEGKEVYEHWDMLNDNLMKGFSYKLKNTKMEVSEYLELSKTGNEIIYTATVINQNQGEGVAFKLIQSDSIVAFENPLHDFPKRISYHKLSNNEIFVDVSDGKQKGFSYKMSKLVSKAYAQDTTVSNPNYDPILAQKLGGDDFGMKSYILVILKTGSNTTTDKEIINSSFRGHLDNIARLVEQGIMIVAGPIGKNDKTYRGIFILNVKTIDDVKELLQTDPAVKEGLLDVELYNWYGSAALPEYLEYSDRIWKSKP